VGSADAAARVRPDTTSPAGPTADTRTGNPPTDTGGPPVPETTTEPDGTTDDTSTTADAASGHTTGAGDHGVAVFVSERAGSRGGTADAFTDRSRAGDPDPPGDATAAGTHNNEATNATGSPAANVDTQRFRAAEPDTPLSQRHA
jgi:hypothetical protein